MVALRPARGVDKQGTDRGGLTAALLLRRRLRPATAALVVVLHLDAPCCTLQYT